MLTCRRLHASEKTGVLSLELVAWLALGFVVAFIYGGQRPIVVQGSRALVKQQSGGVSVVVPRVPASMFSAEFVPVVHVACQPQFQWQVIGKVLGCKGVLNNHRHVTSGEHLNFGSCEAVRKRGEGNVITGQQAGRRNLLVWPGWDTPWCGLSIWRVFQAHDTSEDCSWGSPAVVNLHGIGNRTTSGTKVQRAAFWGLVSDRDVRAFGQHDSIGTGLGRTSGRSGMAGLEVEQETLGYAEQNSSNSEHPGPEKNLPLYFYLLNAACAFGLIALGGWKRGFTGLRWWNVVSALGFGLLLCEYTLLLSGY